MTRLYRFRSLLVLATLAGAVALAGTAAANGGDDPLTAPELPMGIKTFGAKFGPDYWRVYLSQGDLLTLDYGSTDGDRVSFCLLPPTVFSGTATPGTTTTPAGSGVLTDDQCAGRDQTLTKGRLRLGIVNPTGYWVLAFGDGLCAPHNYSTSCAQYPLAYSAQLRVQHLTQMQVALPAVAQRRSWVALAGRVIGVSNGNVQVLREDKGKFRSIGVAAIQVNGSFSKSVRLPARTGLVRYSLVFFGDADHRPSKRTVGIRAA